MKKLILAATALALTTSATSPSVAQSAQERLDERYNRALAAGYKALFLCSAISHAEANGASRSPESVMQWELTGIQAPLDQIVRELPFEILRHDNGTVERVKVDWAEDSQPRAAIHLDNDRGCALNPIMGPGHYYGRPANPVQSRLRVPPPINEAPRTLRPSFEGAFSGAYGEGARTTVVLVRYKGKTVGERYIKEFDYGTPQRTWSVAKSIAATVIGAAVQRGDATVESSAGLGFKRGEPREEITIDHALRMASGRYSDTPGNRTDPLYWGGASVLETALGWPLVYKPGTVYRYANNDTLAAVQAIAGTFDDHPPSELFAKLGMTHTVAEIDWRGQYIMSSQAWTTARDLAKLGQLYLDDGVLPDGTRILPEGWVEYVSDPSGPQPEGTQWGYGAGWWTFRRPEGNAFEGIPDDAFAARGNRGQYVVVVPSRDVVIVRRGEDMVGTRFDIAAFTRDVLAALEE
ncbi:beta-lactamase [Erythrobacter longus]|uniref:Beta-lactamase n=1 Tax=Erythrobacter longus TaxID=1044 RepID=A0A074ME74_ERYLO|nr:serine hydrolase [Erythrobacter longus]KEO91789.1 beta-lactamase [Erythrobacter longus]